ncbi:fibronectin type III domain-containing protein, partial [Akkermansiaceae bacterium]|nr:fibronectin type III domain-containing protein [Akkermansiaceae bacterium]
APERVTNFIAETLFYDSAHLTWNQASGATRYEITTLPETTTQTSNSLNSHLFTGLSSDSLYNFTITSYIGDQVGNTVTITNLLTAPDSVTNFSNSLATYNDVYLTWDASGGATDYEIVSVPETTTQISDGPTYHTFTGLNDNTTYNFTITSKNSDQIGNFATINGIVTAPERVTDFSNALATYNEVDLSWIASPGATRYELVSNPATTTQNSDTTTSHKFIDLDDNTTYNFTITAYNGDQVGNTSSISDVITAPERVLNLSNAVPSSSNIILSWNSASGADEYYIVANTDPETTETTSETSYNFTGLSPSTSYSFEVISYNGEHEGNSVSISATTAINAPQSMARSGSSITIGAVTHNSITMTWTESLGATYYEVSEPDITTSTVSTESVTISGLDSNKTYNFTITPYNETDIAGGSISSGNITTAPGSVSYLKSSALNNDSITLEWDSSDGASKYIIQPNNGLSAIEVDAPATSQLISGLSPNTLYTFSITSHDGTNSGGVYSISGSPSYSYSSVVSGFDSTTYRNGYVYDTSTNAYGVKVFSQLSDKPYVIEQASNTTDVNDTDYTLGSLVDMDIPSEVSSSVIASYQEGFYIEFEVDNALISHINPSKFRYKQVSHSRENPFNILLIGKEFASSDWTYLKEKTSIADSVDWFESDTISASGKFSIFRMYMDASSAGIDKGVSLTDFDIIGDGYLRSQDSGTGILTAPGAVTGISYTDVTEESATITWNAATGANAYSVTNGSTTKYTNETNTIIYDDLSGGTIYNFTITSLNDTLSGGSGSIANILTAPDAVDASTLTNVATTDTTIELSWTGVEGATKYVVSNGSDIQNTDTTSIIFNSLSADTLYNFTVTSYNGDVIEGGQSSISSITTGPAAVTDFTNGATTNTSIELTWTGSSNATKYVVNGTDGITQNTENTSITISGLSAYTAYTFSVTSYLGDTIRGGTSSEIIKRTAPAAPTDLSASFTEWSFDKIDLSWTAPLGPPNLSYSIVTNPVTTTQTTTDTTYQYTGLDPNTLYQFYITSVSGGKIGGTASVSETPGPRAPNTLSNTLSNYNTITVNWDSASGIDKYTVSERVDQIGNWNNYDILDTSATTYTFTNLTSNDSHQIRILARRDGKTGTGRWLWPVTTAPDRVDSLTTSSITSSSIKLTWTEPTNSTNVTYYVTAPGITTRSTTGTTVTMTGLNSSQSYTFTVTPKNGNHAGRTRTITASTSGGWAVASGYSGITTTNGYYGSTRMFNEVASANLIKLGSQTVSNFDDIVSTAMNDKTWSNPDHSTSNFGGMLYGFGFDLYVRTGWSTLTHFLPTQFRFQNHGERNETPSHVKLWGKQDNSDGWT